MPKGGSHCQSINEGIAKEMGKAALKRCMYVFLSDRYKYIHLSGSISTRNVSLGEWPSSNKQLIVHRNSPSEAAKWTLCWRAGRVTCLTMGRLKNHHVLPVENHWRSRMQLSRPYLRGHPFLPITPSLCTLLHGSHHPPYFPARKERQLTASGNCTSRHSIL